MARKIEKKEVDLTAIYVYLIALTENIKKDLKI